MQLLEPDFILVALMCDALHSAVYLWLIAEILKLIDYRQIAATGNGNARFIKVGHQKFYFIQTHLNNVLGEAIIPLPLEISFVVKRLETSSAKSSVLVVRCLVFMTRKRGVANDRTGC